MAQWKAMIIRFVDTEFRTLKEYCEKHHIKMTELIRNAVRHYIANPNTINGVVKVSDNGAKINDVLQIVNKVAQKLDVLDKKLGEYQQDGKLADSVIKARIKECVLKVKQKCKNKPITADKLRLQLQKMDASLTPYLFASATNGFSLLDEVLMELQGRELTRDFNGIIKFIGD
ncbi:MAG: hypothetical protein QXE06_07830 [Candidatus Bathyarchaeia archaeon]